PVLFLLTAGSKRGKEQAAAVPAEHFAVDELDPGLRETFFDLADMPLAKGVGFARQEDGDVRAGEVGEIDLRIPVVCLEDIGEAGVGKHLVDKGVASGGHPR